MKLKDFDYTVNIKTPIYPTETEQKILFCLKQIFPEAEFEVNDEEIKGESESLQRFKKILKDMKIRDTARSYMLNNIRKDECFFVLSKQATCSKTINFSEEQQPLGGVEVRIRSINIDELINNITMIEE